MPAALPSIDLLVEAAILEPGLGATLGRPQRDAAAAAVMTSIPALRVDGDLSIHHYGVSPGVALSYSEAARVCLDRHHQSPVSARIQAVGEVYATSFEWEVADDRLRAAHANETDATEASL